MENTPRACPCLHAEVFFYCDAGVTARRRGYPAEQLFFRISAKGETSPFGEHPSAKNLGGWSSAKAAC
jgi:hypothetical protein